MFKKNIIKISLVMTLIALAFPATTIAMQQKDETYTTKDKKENKTNDFKPNSLNKIETLKENTPKSENREEQKLNDLDLSLNNLIKDFNAELVKIKETSNNYAGSRLIKTIEKHIQTLKEKEYFPLLGNNK